MPAWQAVLLVPAGVLAGLSGSIAGLASLVSYPALLGVGLSPVTANVTNTAALVFNSVGSISASRPELAGQRRDGIRLGITGVIAGTLGAVLLLSTPRGSFAYVVPWLVALGAVGVLVERPRRVLVPGPMRARALVPLVFLIAIYGGYFGAGAGVLLLSTFLNLGGDTLVRSNALKNLVLGLANSVAAVVFIGTGSVDWHAAAPLALGCLLGGALGPVLLRRVPARPVRVLIGLAGLGLAVYLGLDAYG